MGASKLQSPIEWGPAPEGGEDGPAGAGAVVRTHGVSFQHKNGGVLRDDGEAGKFEHARDSVSRGTDRGLTPRRRRAQVIVYVVSICRHDIQYMS